MFFYLSDDDVNIVLFSRKMFVIISCSFYTYGYTLTWEVKVLILKLNEKDKIIKITPYKKRVLKKTYLH